MKKITLEKGGFKGLLFSQWSLKNLEDDFWYKLLDSFKNDEVRIVSDELDNIIRRL